MSFFKPESNTKRYLLFYGDTYYPSGGWGDFRGSYDEIEEALLVLHGSAFDWFHIVDSATGEKVVQ